MYVDSIDQTIKVGDYVVYAMSGYARIAKILEIKPTGRIAHGHRRRGPEIEITVMTAAENKTFRRTYKFVPFTTQNKTSSLIRIDQPPLVQETLIEQRLAQK